MKLQRRDGELGWWPDGSLPARRIAGPFGSRADAYGWYIEHMEGQFTASQKALWGECLVRAGSHDLAHLLGLIEIIGCGWKRESVLRAAYPIRR